jgi:putative addiction module component (TIGR02574 family)
MVTTDLAKLALELPPEERLELARRLVESVVEPAPLHDALAEGIRRVEDVFAGRTKPLTEAEYRAALK